MDNKLHFLNKNLIKNVLEKGFKQNAEIKKLEFCRGSSGGDNYCSDIIRLKIHFENGVKEIKMIIKCIQPTLESQLLLKMGVFDREVAMYFEILPRIEIFLQKQFSPICYDFCTEPCRTFFMEDLSDDGYQLADRVVGMDLEHSKLVMKSLGEFHAGSMILTAKYPSLAEEVTKPAMFGEKKEDLNVVHDAMFGKTFETFVSVISDSPKFGNISTKLMNVQKKFYEKICEVYSNKSDKIKVINHGDCWVNNIMFKYADGKPIGLKVIDFQFSYYANPGIDINYFMAISCQFDVLSQSRETLLQIYHKSLTEILQSHNFANIPTLEDIKNEVNQKEFYGFIAFSTLLPILSMDSKDSADNSLANMGSKDKQKQIFNGERFQKQLEFSLNRYDNLGLFNV